MTATASPDDAPPLDDDWTAYASAARHAVAQAFRTHWAAVAERLIREEPLIEERQDTFFAKQPEQLALARAFYTSSRARAFAAMSDDDIARQLEPWLDHVIAAGESEGAKPEFAAGFVTSTYVFVRVDCDGEVKDAQPYPAFHMYDDLYEFAGATFPGAYVLVYKSTGEAFTDEEIAAAEPYIETHVELNAKSNGMIASASVGPSSQRWDGIDFDDRSFLVEVSIAEEQDDDADDDDESDVRRG